MGSHRPDGAGDPPASWDLAQVSWDARRMLVGRAAEGERAGAWEGGVERGPNGALTGGVTPHPRGCALSEPVRCNAAGCQEVRAEPPSPVADQEHTSHLSLYPPTPPTHLLVRVSHGS